MNTRNYLQTILGILLMGCAFSASSQDYWVDIGSVEAEEQDGVVLVPVRINQITDQGFTVPGEVGSGDNVRVWYSTTAYDGIAFDRNNSGTSNRPKIDTVSGEDYEEKSGWIRFQPGDSEKFISITLINDDKHELGEAVIIDLSFANDAEQGTSTDGKSAFQSNQGHVFIQNNDCFDWEVQLSEAVPPNCRLPIATAPGVEENEGEDIEISVILDAPVRVDTTFTYEFDLAPDDTDVNLARKEDFVLSIDTGRTDSNDDPIFVDNPVLFNGGIFDPTGNIVVPAGSTKGSFTLPLRKRDGYEKRRETFDVTLEVTKVRGAVMVDVSTNSNTNETRPSLDWEDLPTANLADGNITASIVNVDECERGIDDSDGTGDSGHCRLYPEVILGHHTPSRQRVEGTEQRFGGRGRRNTAPSYFDEVWDDDLKINWRLVPDTAMAGVDYTGPESGTLDIQKTGRSFVDLPFWGSSAFLIPTVDRPGAQGPRTFYVEVTPHADNPELLFIVPESQFSGPADYDFWDFGQTRGCDTGTCRFPITFSDGVGEEEEIVDEGNFFPGKMRLSAPSKTPEYSGVVFVGVVLDELDVPYSFFESNENGKAYTPVRVQTFDTGTGDGYATVGTDYRAVDVEETLILEEGSIYVGVPIVIDDGLVEGDEEFGFRVTLLDFDDVSLEGTVLILDEEIESGAYISINTGLDHNGNEGSRIEIQFQITGDYQSPRTYEVEVFTELLGNGTGYANSADFVHKSQTFTVSAVSDDVYTSFFVDTLGDSYAEPAEKLRVVLRLKEAPDLTSRSAAVTVTINASDGTNPLDVEDSVDEVACTLHNNSCDVDDEMIGIITAITETMDGLERSVYVDAIAGGNCCQKCASDSIVGSNVIVETLESGVWGSGVTGGIVDADIGEYLRTLQQFTDSCEVTVGVQLTYPYEDLPLYILDLKPEEASVVEGGEIVLTATLDPAQDEALSYYLIAEVPEVDEDDDTVNPAKIGVDFVDLPITTFEFAVGVTEKNHHVLTLVDDEDEPNETFSVRLGKDGVSFPAVYSAITIINGPTTVTNDEILRDDDESDGDKVGEVSETVFTYTDNIDGSIRRERANFAGQYEFLLNDTSRPKRPNGRYRKLRVSDWYTVTMSVHAFALNGEDGNGTSLDCPTDLASGQNAEFDWGDGNSVGFYVYGAFVSNNGARCVFEASPSGHTGDPGQVPSGAVTVTFTPAID